MSRNQKVPLHDVSLLASSSFSLPDPFPPLNNFTHSSTITFFPFDCKTVETSTQETKNVYRHHISILWSIRWRLYNLRINSNNNQTWSIFSQLSSCGLHREPSVATCANTHTQRERERAMDSIYVSQPSALIGHRACRSPEQPGCNDTAALSLNIEEGPLAQREH